MGMGTGHADRLWMIGGAVAAVVLIAVGWFFLISPQNGRTATFTGQTDDAHTKLITLQQHLSQLQRQNEDLAGYQTKLRSEADKVGAEGDQNAGCRIDVGKELLVQDQRGGAAIQKEVVPLD